LDFGTEGFCRMFITYWYFWIVCAIYIYLLLLHIKLIYLNNKSLEGDTFICYEFQTDIPTWLDVIFDKFKGHRRFTFLGVVPMTLIEYFWLTQFFHMLKCFTNNFYLVSFFCKPGLEHPWNKDNILGLRG